MAVAADSPPPPPPANASPGGIWLGTDPISASSVLGLVAETGQLFFSDEAWTSSGAYYVGKFITNGNATNANVDAITAQFSRVFQPLLDFRDIRTFISLDLGFVGVRRGI